ncbi:MAG: indoleacetamide hydrolase [Rhodospirillales bacterium]
MNTANLSAIDALSAMQSGDISCENYVGALVERAEAYEDLNAFISFDAERVLEAACAADEERATGAEPGPLLGLPIVLKDNIDTAQYPTTGGTPGLRENQPTANSPVAQSLFDAGAICFGKSNLHELAYGVTCNNGAFGPSRNPYNRERIPGGSSGGTGTAVGARIAPAGLGSDTGGSVRIPAALCGIVGFRPTTGRYSQEGVVPISNTRDTIGPMTRSVADAALLDRVIAGEDDGLQPAELKGLRIGVPRGYYYEDLDMATALVMDAALERLSGYGIELIEADVPDVAAADEAASMPVALYETVVLLNRYLNDHGIGLDYAELVSQIGSPDVKGIMGSLIGEGAIPPELYKQALEQYRPRLRDIFRNYFAENNLSAIVFPTTPMPAAKIGDDETVNVNGTEVPTFMTYIRNTDPASNAALPGLSIPAGLTDAGLPVGMEFDGPEGSDRELLSIGYAVEEMEPAFPEPTLDP